MIPLPKPKMSAVDVVDFVVAYFSADPDRRSLNPGNEACLYRGKGGRLCAFALFVHETALDHLVEGLSAVENLDVQKVRLRPEVEHLRSFDRLWDSVQHLHDADCMWDNCGLTSVGEAQRCHVRHLAGAIDAQLGENTHGTDA